MHIVTRLFMVLVGVPGVAQAAEPPPQPCVVADVPAEAVRDAFARAVRPVYVPPPPPVRRWVAWVPVHVGVGLHDGVRSALGWSETLAGPSGRWSQFDDQWVRLTIAWDLRPLTAEPPPRPVADMAQRLEPLLRAEQLAMRAAESVKSLRSAQLLASSALAGDPLCRQAQGEAEAAALVLDALIAASR